MVLPMSTCAMAWRWYKDLVLPSYIREEDMFLTNEDVLWARPRKQYAWVMMKALLILKLELKDKPWLCGEQTLQQDINYVQGLIDSWEKENGPK